MESPQGIPSLLISPVNRKDNKYTKLLLYNYEPDCIGVAVMPEEERQVDASHTAFAASCDCVTASDLGLDVQ